jgi:hypothetical protein
MSGVFTAAVGFAGWFMGIRPLADNSFFWHLRTGHLILDVGIPRSDPYSFTSPGVKWVAQSWLAEALYGVVDDLAGRFGLRVLVAVTAACIAILLFRIALRMTHDRVRALLVTAPALTTVAVVMSPRPLLFGLLGAAVLVWLVEVPSRLSAPARAAALAVTLWSWANVHGSWTLGVVYIGLHLAGRAAEERSAPWTVDRGAFVGGIIGSAATIINPYGIDLVLFPLRLLGRADILANVVEWMSPNFNEPAGQLYALWLAVVVVGWTRARPPLRDVVVGLPFLLLGLWALRNVGIAAVVTLPIAARAFRSSRPRADVPAPAHRLAVAAIVVLGGLVAVQAASEKDLDLGGYSVDAFAALDAQGLLGRRMFHTDGDAGYLILEYWPRQRVFSDDRFDMYPRSVLEDYDTLAQVEPEYTDALDRWQIEVVVWPRERALSQALRADDGWRLHWEDDDVSVFLRRPAS